MLRNFYKEIADIVSSSSSLVNRMQCLKSLMQASLLDHDFKLACIQRILASIDESRRDERLWSAPLFYYHPELKFSVRMIFWPEHYENNPHQHKTWSVTGVFYNHLNIKLYKLPVGSDKPEVTREISAVSGASGYLLPGCIHNITNPNASYSASLHIFNNIDVLKPEENAIWYPAPIKKPLANGLVNRALLICHEVASTIHARSETAYIHRGIYP